MAYQAKAVHFNGASYLSTNSLTSTDNGKFSMSFWFKGVIGLIPPQQPTIFVTDPGVNANCKCVIHGGGAVVTDWFLVHLDNVPVGHTLSGTNTVPLVTDTNWHHFLYSFDAALARTPSQIYIDSIAQSSTQNQAGSNSFPGQMMNGRSFFFGGSNVLAFGYLTGDIADVWIAPGVSLIDSGTLTILPATMLNFVDASGRPKDPATFPAGGVVVLTGDHTTFGTNAGTGGALTLTGALTDAATNPSTGTIGFANPIRTTWVANYPDDAFLTVITGWSDPQSNYAYFIYSEAADSNFTAVKIDRTTNLVVQTATIAGGAAPALPGMSSTAGMAAPWSDPTRAFAVSYAGAFDWYVVTLSRSTLLPTHTAKVQTANANPPTGPFNDYTQVSCSADGAYVAFCSNSVPVSPNVSQVGIYKSSNDAFATTTATSLGITTDAFQSIVMDASNNIYCGGQATKIYKLTFDTGTLVASLAATFDLSASLPAPNGKWAAYSITYRQPTGTLLVWFYDTGGTPLASRMLEISTSGAVVSGPLVFPHGDNQMSYNPFTEFDLPPIAHWTNRTKFVGATFSGARATFRLIDIVAQTVTAFPDSLWVNASSATFISPGLADYDASIPSLWMSTFQIPATLGGNPPAQLILPGPAPPNFFGSVGDVVGGGGGQGGASGPQPNPPPGASPSETPSVKAGAALWVPIGPFRDSIFPN